MLVLRRRGRRSRAASPAAPERLGAAPRCLAALCCEGARHACRVRRPRGADNRGRRPGAAGRTGAAVPTRAPSRPVRRHERRQPRLDLRSAWSRTPTPARPRLPARCSAATSATCAMRRTSPSSPTCTRARDPRRRDACGCGTRRASATACAWPSGCGQSGNPLGWFLSEVWDRWRDRAFWASQQAMRNVRDARRRVLYLVNAAEAPAAAGYVAPEMELLGWVGKPVIVLLNQLGAPRESTRRGRRGRALAPPPGRACAGARGAAARRLRALLGPGADAARARSRRRCRRPRGARGWRACAAPGARGACAVFDAAMQSIAASLARIATAPVAGRRRGLRATAAQRRRRASAWGSAEPDARPRRRRRALAAAASTPRCAPTPLS